ncbi:aminotransferase class V-fold PLP-dependent enzyme [Pseudonocardia hydrocarbonoxydans]|uniref:Aminotransferase class V n=1 Tax=Pseudonocardia hydrocarbonoxydans TaxID=76726 RepID=A0A4Y3WQC2_9PSEU|nr:aminotransferase class V-fold PLP-dependent enzyme [Pseudonocardia hydrocarbonoxydans]GEC19566.1 aminotransferase class V [Pseudonocardia hydrocarbonoxydans]
MRNAFGRRFDVPDTYLNTASIGIPPDDAADAVADAVRAWRTGAGRPADFDAPVATARAAWARLVGVPVGRVAIGATVSGLLSTVAAALPPRSRVLVAAGEFTSVTWPFAARGHELTEVPLDGIGARAAEFDAVAVSVVQSADGRIVDLDALRAARASGTRVVLDTTQATGWLDADLGWADAVACGAYKWLLSPRGAAWLAVHPGWDPPAEQAGWFAGEQVWDSVYGLPLRLAAGARSLDTSPAWLSHVGAAVALPWLAGLDRAAVHAHCTGLADALRAGLGMEPAGSAIVAVRTPDAQRRLDAAGVVGAARAGAARLAFHLYNTRADVDAALEALT